MLAAISLKHIAFYIFTSIEAFKQFMSPGCAVLYSNVGSADRVHYVLQLLQCKRGGCIVMLSHTQL